MTPFHQMIEALKPTLAKDQLRGFSTAELADRYFELIEAGIKGPSTDVVMMEVEIDRRGLSADGLLMGRKRAA
jgi:hypothetical protein